MKDYLEYLRVITFFSKHFNKWFPRNDDKKEWNPEFQPQKLIALEK